MPESSSEYSRKFVDYLKSADEKQRINEYTWLIKGFFEIAQGIFLVWPTFFLEYH